MVDRNELTPQELARLYIEQLDSWAREEQAEEEIYAVNEWEELICDDPERAWPVFLEIVALRSDDETLIQAGFRLRLLLHRHWEAFHERAEALVRGTPRFPLIVGEDFFDAEQYRETPLDVEELVRDYHEMNRRAPEAHRVDDITRHDPRSGLAIAIEIIHRGPANGFGSFDTFAPLHDVLRYHGPAVIDEVEQIARESYLVRRCLWRMIPGENGNRNAGASSIDAEVWKRVLAANAGTTDFTGDVDPQPVSRPLAADHESILDAWFAYEHAFWAVSVMSDLVQEEPETAWTVFLELLRRNDDSLNIASLAAGPLEDLLKNHGPLLFDRIAAESGSNAKLRDALSGVWLSPEDEIHDRYVALMQNIC